MVFILFLFLKELLFKDVSVVVNQKLAVLNKNTGMIQAGKLTAIMGSYFVINSIFIHLIFFVHRPSGAGKTTLLNQVIVCLIKLSQVTLFTW